MNNAFQDFLKSFEDKEDIVEDKKETEKIKEEPKKKIKLNLKKLNIEDTIQEKENKAIIPKENNINIDKLFMESETESIWRDRWEEIFKKAWNSDAKTQTNKKVRQGKFRIDNDGKLEILPNHPTYGKESKQLLNERWEIK